jgi:folate-binding protein YgfZ
MKAAFLPDRAIIKVAGEDARGFLDNLITSDVGKVRPGQARFGALLTPQGKIIADFLISEPSQGAGGGFLLDCPAQLAKTLTDRLSLYKLRAKATIENLSGIMGILAVWQESGPIAEVTLDLAFADPRSAALGWRIPLPEAVAAKAALVIGATLVDATDYESHRIACGVPRGGADFLYGDAFPHEANMDRLSGVDFDKGCYIGQEVVSRMQHRGTARTRVTHVIYDGAPPPAQTDIMAGDKKLGTSGASSGREGLALLRLDRVADAQSAHEPITADGITLQVKLDDAINHSAKVAE